MYGLVTDLAGVQNIAPNNIDDMRVEDDATGTIVTEVVNVSGPRWCNPAIEQLVPANGALVNK